MKNTVIFDLDGTLLDTLEDLYQSANAVLKIYGFPEKTKEEVRQSVGNGVRVLMRYMVPEGESNPCFEDCILAFQKYYLQHLNDHTMPYRGIMELLKRLKEQGWKIAIVSNKPDKAVKELSRQIFGNMVSLAVGESAKMKRKPAPDTVYAAMRELGVQKETCVYVGDSEVDFETAKNSDVLGILVSWGFRSQKELEALGAERIVHSPEELFSCLEQFAKTEDK